MFEQGCSWASREIHSKAGQRKECGEERVG